MELCVTHYGHKLRIIMGIIIELGHLRLPENIKLAIAGKLRQGVTMEHILDDVREMMWSVYICLLGKTCIILKAVLI